jgi:hypothetical protein
MSSLQIEFVTEKWLPPDHFVTLHTSINGWADFSDAGGWNGHTYYWAFPADPASPTVEFKFVLVVPASEAYHWMAGPNQVIGLDQAYKVYTDEAVEFEP